MKNTEMAALVSKVQGDKKSYFEELYNATWRTVYYRCYKMLENEQDTHDATQMVFIELHKIIDTLRAPNAFNKFMHTTINYVCLNFRRKKSRDEADELDDYESMEEEKVEFLPSEAYEREDIRSEIAKIIGELPEKQREAILLFYFENLSMKEIAEITDSGVGAVQNRLVKARKSLRERAETLIEKGALDKTMAILPIPIITRILLEEANAVAPAEAGALIWQGVCGAVETVAAATTTVAATESAATTATTTATTSSTVVNVAIGITCAAIIAGTVYLGLYVNDNFINPPPIVAEYEESDAFDIAALIPTITNRSEFIDFTYEFGFTLVSSSRSTERGNRMLFYLEEPERFIYLGYTESLDGEFRVLYEITEERLQKSDEDIAAWFARL
ncbi:MAG: sigma-70 family RNA polymerase sigma factor [Oscillospiraceae bacterium]|nr:sigma-70 family RNA polymerase sigma factor [Oscillospiraceae bacterium]